MVTLEDSIKRSIWIGADNCFNFSITNPTDFENYKASTLNISGKKLISKCSYTIPEPIIKKTNYRFVQDEFTPERYIKFNTIEITKIK